MDRDLYVSLGRKSEPGPINQIAPDSPYFFHNYFFRLGKGYK